jgi:feruloyl esterase
MRVAALALLLAAVGPAAAVDLPGCAELANFRAAGVVVTAATPIQPAPAWEPPAGQGRGRPVTVPFCRIEGVIEGRIGFELWLPDRPAWNRRLLGAGVGGDAGVYNYHDLARGLEAGFAAVTNDSGHKAAEANWMMRREAVLDYTHRSQHLMNRAARALVEAHYGQAADYAYFIGCSGGGRQALSEIQLYPDDYDGVIAGAAGPTMPVMSVRHLWQALYQQRNPDGAMSDADWNVVAAAAVRACDADDGLADGIVENPAHCVFDPGVVQCRDGETAGCLPAAKVTTVRTFYAPLRDENGRQLDGGLVPGVRTRPGPPSPLLLPVFGQGAHQRLDWDPSTLHMANDLALVDRMMPKLRADNPDLRPFARRGGRVILYQGWLDPSIVADNTLAYHAAVQSEMGADAAQGAMRLYLVPGMLHCRGGAGVDEFGGAHARLPLGDAQHDLLAALQRWVEAGEAPVDIIGSRLENGATVMQRRLCPYPATAVYQGGDPNRAGSFQCH